MAHLAKPVVINPLRDQQASRKVAVSGLQQYNAGAGTSGTVLLNIKEPQSKEMLRNKKVELEEISDSYGGTVEKGQLKAGTVKWKDWNDQTRNIILKGLEKHYNAIMEELDKLLAPGEMDALKRQAEEIKAKKNY